MGANYMIKRTVLPRAEQPWQPPYQYECSSGHRLGADRALTRCPACHHGQPCTGQLRRVGTGSRAVTA